MESVLKHYDSLKLAIDSDLYEEAGQHMTQLDTSLRQLFATPPQLTDSDQRMLAEISEFLSSSCDKMIANRADVESELKSFSNARKMKKAYGK